MGFRQCLLERRVTGGYDTRLAWLPQEFARVGKIIKIREASGEEWSDGWEVRAVWGWLEKPPDVHASVRQHERRTGDTLPKVK